MFETAIKYKELFEKDIYDIYYRTIGYKLRKRKIKVLMLIGLVIVEGLRRDYIYKENIDNTISLMVLKISCIILFLVGMYILFFDWHKFYGFLNKKLYLEQFKDNDPINVNITSDEAYITYHSEKILLLPKYPLIQINKNKHFRVFVYDTQKYIFFTMTNTYYFIYIDKEQFSADKIKELQENLQNIYGKCYVKKY